MKLFVLLSRVPYPIEKGDKLRAFHQLRCLSEEHEIVLCALSDRPVHPDALKILGTFCREIHIIRLHKPGMLWNTFKALLSGKPLQTGYFYRCQAKREIDALIKRVNPDHIFCQLIRVAEYVKNLPIHKTLDYQDIFSIGMKRRADNGPFWLKPVFMLEFRRLQRYERLIFKYFDQKIIISKPDRDLIPHPDRDQIAIIPNGVDHAYFSPGVTEKKYDVVFTGNMGYAPNVDAACYLAEDILPRVQNKIPGVRLLIAGAAPHTRVQALAGEHITVSGWMPDIRDAYAASRLFIAPMRIGTGLQNKLLEAMSMKLPCITTTLANQALGASNDRQILVGDTREQLAAQIIRLLSDEGLAKSIASEGNKFVKEVFDWKQTAIQITQLMKKCTPHP